MDELDRTPNPPLNRPDPRPLRVGFVIDTLAPGAGTENQLLLLLRTLDRRRVSPHLCCLWDHPALATLDTGCPVTVLGFHRLASAAGWRGFRAFRRWVKTERLDLVVTFFRDANLVGTLGSRSVGVPVLSNRRNLGRGYWHTPWELAKLRVLNRMTERFLANSEAVRAYTAEAEGVPRDRIERVYNAVDAERFRPRSPEERAGLRRDLGLPAEALLVGCVANLRPIKGVDVLVAAWERVAAELPGARLVLAGEGPDRPALEAAARRAGTLDRIHFLGPCSDPAPVLGALDLAVLPSRGEGFSNALLEYGAAGVPAIATRVGGNPELIRSSDHGRLVPPEDPAALAGAILELGRDPALRSRIGATVRRTALEEFQPGVILEDWVRVLEKTARRSR